MCAILSGEKEYRDRREMLIKALFVGENSGESERSIKDIWSGV